MMAGGDTYNNVIALPEKVNTEISKFEGDLAREARNGADIFLTIKAEYADNSNVPSRLVYMASRIDPDGQLVPYAPRTYHPLVH